MSQAALKGVVWTGVIVATGYGLMKAFTPSESYINEQLRLKDQGERRQKNKDLMAILKKNAGIEETDTNKK
ncbi:hypothetical protein V1264_019359 [Littorina saxatilis]|uniref:Uncharacterized protein n=1 Tax=Littorina saxatilis TaxID=31220 RepID=A0AAN9BEI0_9CAEN